MPWKTEALKAAEAEIERQRRVIAALTNLPKVPDECPVPGCQDHGCLVNPPKGMGTNGRCTCDEATLKRALRWAKRKIEHDRRTTEGNLAHTEGQADDGGKDSGHLD